MIRPAYFVRLTPLYIVLSLFLVALSVPLKLLGKSHTDLLIFLVFPVLIKGTLFQLYPTLQGIPLKGSAIPYLHFLLVLLNLLYWLFRNSVEPVLYTLENLLFLLFIFLNTRRLSDTSVAFLFVGSLYILPASMLVYVGSEALLTKHVLTLGFFLNVIICSYYIFVPMLQLEELWAPKLRWLNLLLHNFSSALVLYGFYMRNYSLVAYGGFGVLVSLFLLSLILHKTLSQRKSPLKGLDPSVKLLLLGLFLLIAFLSLGVASAGTQNFGFINFHREGMLYGFLTFITVGASYHILPFMLWWRLYAPRMGREKIPTLKELLKPEVIEAFLMVALPSLLFYLLLELFNTALANIFLTALSLSILYYTLKLVPLSLRALGKPAGSGFFTKETSKQAKGT